LAGAALVSWSEVTQFTGSRGYMTEDFTCTHVEWRMNWNYTPSPSYPSLAGFSIVVYSINQDISIASVMQMGNTTTNGTSYIHNQKGTFYLDIIVGNVENYVIVIEQDVDSLPEFSTMVLLSLLLSGTLVAMTLARRLEHRSLSQR